MLLDDVSLHLGYWEVLSLPAQFQIAHVKKDDTFFRTPDSYYFSHQKTGALMSRVTMDVAQVAQIFSARFAGAVLEGSQLLVYLTIIFLVQWKLALSSVLVLSLLIFPIMIFQAKINFVDFYNNLDQKFLFFYFFYIAQTYSSFSFFATSSRIFHASFFPQLIFVSFAPKVLRTKTGVSMLSRICREDGKKTKKSY